MKELETNETGLVLTQCEDTPANESCNYGCKSPYYIPDPSNPTIFCVRDTLWHHSEASCVLWRPCGNRTNDCVVLGLRVSAMSFFSVVAALYPIVSMHRWPPWKWLAISIVAFLGTILTVLLSFWSMYLMDTGVFDSVIQPLLSIHSDTVCTLVVSSSSSLETTAEQAQMMKWCLPWIFMAPWIVASPVLALIKIVRSRKQRPSRHWDSSMSLLSSPSELLLPAQDSQVSIGQIQSEMSLVIDTSSVHDDSLYDEAILVPAPVLVRELIEVEVMHAQNACCCSTTLLAVIAYLLGLLLSLSQVSLDIWCQGTTGLVLGTMVAKYAAWLVVGVSLFRRWKTSLPLFYGPTVCTVMVFGMDIDPTDSYLGIVQPATYCCLVTLLGAMIFEARFCKTLRLRSRLAAVQLKRAMKSGVDADGKFQHRPCPTEMQTLFHLTKQLPEGRLASLIAHSGSMAEIVLPPNSDEPHLNCSDQEVQAAVSQLTHAETLRHGNCYFSFLDVLVRTAQDVTARTTDPEISPQKTEGNGHDASKRFSIVPNDSSADAAIRKLWDLARKCNRSLRVHNFCVKDIVAQESPNLGLWQAVLECSHKPLLQLLRKCSAKDITPAVLSTALDMTIKVAPQMLTTPLDSRDSTFLHLVMEYCISGDMNAAVGADIARRCIVCDPSLSGLCNSRGVDVTQLALSSGLVQLISVLSMSFYKRFQLISQKPQHKSATCEVYYCSDMRREFVTPDGQPLPLAIKMMRDKSHWECEMQFRREHDLNRTDVVPILWPVTDQDMRTMQGRNDSTVNAVSRDTAAASNESSRDSAAFLATSSSSAATPTTAQSKAVLIMQRFPFSCVMPRANRTLYNAICEAHIAGIDHRLIASILRNVAMCLQGIHFKGVIHGDVKPRNIVQMSTGAWMLIDMDASAAVGTPLNKRLSTAYAAPEVIRRLTGQQEDQSQLVISAASSSIIEQKESSQLKLNPTQILNSQLPSSAEPGASFDNSEQKVEASPPPNVVGGELASRAHDVWSLGAVMFELMCGQSLVDKNVYDNAKPSGLHTLQHWTGLSDEEKALVFHLLPDQERSVVMHHAVDLVTRCLAADPAQRPSMKEIVGHPFLAISSVQDTELQVF